MPDERRYLQSKFKKKTCNPKFEESYVFQVITYRTCMSVIYMLFTIMQFGNNIYLFIYHSCEFLYQVPSRSFSDRVLKLTVFDVDRQKKHHVIGHALYVLREDEAEGNERLVIWRDLEKDVVEVLYINYLFFFFFFFFLLKHLCNDSCYHLWWHIYLRPTHTSTKMQKRQKSPLCLHEG